MSDFNRRIISNKEIALLLLGGEPTNSYCYTCEKSLSNHSNLLRHIKSEHLQIKRMSKKRSIDIDAANEEVNSMKRCNINDITIAIMLKRDHTEKRFNCNNAIAQVFYTLFIVLLS